MLIDDIENGMLKGRNDYYKSISLNHDPNQLFNHTNAKAHKKNKSIFHKTEFRGFFAKNSSQFQNPHMGKRVVVKVVSYSRHTLNAIPLEIVNQWKIRDNTFIYQLGFVNDHWAIQRSLVVV